MPCKGLADSLKAKAAHGFKHGFCGSGLSVSLLGELFALCFGHWFPPQNGGCSPSNLGFHGT
jgi:hypothetical protein